MLEQRLTLRLQTYWENACKGARMPDYAQFNSSPITDIWQQCMLFTVQPSAPGTPPVLKFYQLGDHLRKIYGQDPTGLTVTTAQRHFEGAKIVARMAEVIEDPRVIIDEGQFFNGKGKMVKYRSCLLPFGRDDNVTHILTGVSWREF